MKTRLSISVVLSLFLASVAFQTFAQDFSAVKTGMSRIEVRNIMGKPDQISVSMLPLSPFSGPQEALLQYIQPGDAFEEWRYITDSKIYLVWFASTEIKPRNSWTVLSKTGYPVGTVF